MLLSNDLLPSEGIAMTAYVIVRSQDVGLLICQELADWKGKVLP